MRDNRTPGERVLASIIGTWVFVGACFVFYLLNHHQLGLTDVFHLAIGWSLGDLLVLLIKSL